MEQTNRRVIAQFRAGGPVEGMNRDGLLLLTTTGRRSGEPRTSPLMFDRDDEDLLVIASNAGAPAHPAWYRNLVANPRVGVEIGDESFDADAEVLTGEHRERVWERLKQRYAFLADHEAGTDRTIPLVGLRRI